MATGFAAGLAQGIQSGLGLHNQMGLMDLHKRQADRLEKADSRESEEHEWKKADREKHNEFLSGFADFTDGLSFRGDGSNRPLNISAPQQSVALLPANQRLGFGLPGLAAGGIISEETFAQAGLGTPRQALTADRGMGLSDLRGHPPVQAEQTAPESNLTASHRIAKAMMSTDLLNNPEKLSKMYAYAEMHGKGDMIKPFLERAYTAKKRGLIDGAMHLMRGQVDEAIDLLKQGGVQLEDRPTRVTGNKWKINISGAGEREMDIGELLQTTLEPDKFLEFQLKQNESQGRRNVSDSQVRAHDSSVRVDNARIGKLGEETKSIREEREATKASGGLNDSRISKLPAPAATAEWLVKNGVYSNHKDAFNAVKTLNDKSPAAQRMVLIEASVKAGLSLPEAAKEVDAFMAHSGTGQGANVAQAPQGAIRKFNPATGRFD